MIDIRCMLGFHKPKEKQFEGEWLRCQRCGRFIGWTDKVKVASIIALMILAVLLLLSGCASGVRNSPSDVEVPVSTLAVELARIGTWGLWVGGAILGLGFLLRIGRIASFAASIIGPVFGLFGITGGIASIASIATEVGGTAAALGMASLWLADHEWLVPWAGGFTALALGFRHRRNIGRWLRLGTRTGPRNEKGT